MQTLSKHAIIARNGNSAERVLCNNVQQFEAYFGKSITSIALVPGRRKSDVSIQFADGTTARLQNKDGDGNHRGWSIDRRALDALPLDTNGKTLLDNVCLHPNEERPIAVCPSTLVAELLLGTDPATAPTHFTHTIVDPQTGTLRHLSIAPADEVIGALTQTLYPTLVPKRTCVHLSPLLYFQRKGGGSKDHAPDHIQVKLKSFPDGILHVL